MLQVVSELQLPNTRPETFGIPARSWSTTRTLFEDFEALQFPVISKPLVADGSAKSHKMSLVYHKAGLLKLQEFLNHSGVIFKIFVVGEFVKCARRKSLPDVSEEEMVADCEGSMTFSQMSILTEKNRKEMLGNEGLEEAEIPPVGFVTEIASGFRSVIG